MKKSLLLFLVILLTFATGLMAININPSIAGNYYKGLTYNPYGLQTVNALTGATTFTYINTTSSGNGMMFVGVDSSGKVWETNYGAPGIPAVYVFDKDGGEVSFSPILFGISASGVTTQIIQPGGVAYNPIDNLMYVVSRDTSNISHVFRFDPTTGAATTGLIDGIFGNPGSVAIDTAGNVFWQNKVGSDFVTINYLTGATTSVTAGTGGGNNRGCGVTPDGSTYFQANDVTNLIHVYTGSIAAGYTLATTLSIAGAPSAVDVIDDKFAVSRTSAYAIDLYQLGTYAYITSIDMQNSSLFGLGASAYGPVKPRGVAISKDSTRLFVANFSSVGPQIGVVPLDYTKILVDNAGSGDFTTVGAAISSINSAGTYAAGTAPFVISIKAGSGPYDESLTLDASSSGGQILGDLVVQSDTPGTKVNIRLQKCNNGTEALRIYQNTYDVTFKDIIFSPSTTKKATSTLIRAQETVNNTNFNWINMFDCVLTDADTTGAPMAVSKSDAISKLNATLPSGSGLTTGVYLLSVNQTNDGFESRNTRIVNTAFYGPLMGAIRVYDYAHNGDIVLLRDDLMVNCGNTSGYAAGCRIGNGSPYYGYVSVEGSNLPTYGPTSCFAVLGAKYHCLYLTFYPVYYPMNVKNVICHSAETTNVRAISAGAVSASANITNAIFDTSPAGPTVLGSVPTATLSNVVVGKNSGLLAFGGLGPLTFNNCIITGSLNQNVIPTGGYFFTKCGLPYQSAYTTSGSTLGSASATFTSIQRADPLYSQVTDPTDPSTYYKITNQYYSAITSAGGLLGGLFVGGSTPASYPQVPIDRILKSINANGRVTFGGATVTIVGAAAQSSNLDPSRFSRYLIDTTTGLGVLADQAAGAATNPAFNSGDIMKITGYVTDYNGVVEFVPYGTTTSENLGASGYAFSTTTTLTAALLNVFDQNRSSGGELYECRFISLSNMTVLSEVTVASGSDANISVTDISGDTTIIRIDKDTLADEYLSTLNGGIITAGSTIDQVRGIVTQYDTSDPRNTGYQIMPSEQADFVNVLIFVPVKDWMLY